MSRRTPLPPLFGCAPSKIVCLFLAFLMQVPFASSIAIKELLELGRGSNNTATTGGKVFFLFLADDSLPNEQIWIRFFATARRGLDFEALVHCRNETACRQGVGSRGLFQVISTVPSKWCEDLISPMNALLQAALRVGGAASRADSFTFISDTTVPVKPFKTVSQRMALDRMRGSSFCVAPKADWGILDSNHSRVVKHSQWLTLSRQHASRVVASAHRMRNLMHLATPDVVEEMFGGFLVKAYQSTLGKVFGRVPLNGCLDEYLYFALVYGFRDGGDDDAWPKPVLDDLQVGQLHTTGSRSTQDFQGQCDTFVYWGYGKQFSKLAGELEADNATLLELPQWGHPAHFESLSTKALHKLYKSDFLFARKIDSRSVRAVSQDATILSLPDAFEVYIFDAA